MSSASCPTLKGDRKGEIICLSQRIFKILENRQPEGPSVRHLLPVLSKIIGLAPGTLVEGTGHFFPKGFCWLLSHSDCSLGCGGRRLELSENHAWLPGVYPWYGVLLNPIFSRADSAPPENLET